MQINVQDIILELLKCFVNLFSIIYTCIIEEMIYESL